MGPKTLAHMLILLHRKLILRFMSLELFIRNLDIGLDFGCTVVL